MEAKYVVLSMSMHDLLPQLSP